jgi:hypothetical protein
VRVWDRRTIAATLGLTVGDARRRTIGSAIVAAHQPPIPDGCARFPQCTLDDPVRSVVELRESAGKRLFSSSPRGRICQDQPRRFERSFSGRFPTREGFRPTPTGGRVALSMPTTIELKIYLAEETFLLIRQGPIRTLR